MKRIGLVLMLAFAVLSAGPANLDAEAPLAATTRTVHLAAIDAKGGIVADLTAADLTVKDGGKDATVSSLTPDTTPMQIAIIVDDGGTGGFQPVVAQVLQGHDRAGGVFHPPDEPAGARHPGLHPGRGTAQDGAGPARAARQAAAGAGAIGRREFPKPPRSTFAAGRHARSSSCSRLAATSQRAPTSTRCWRRSWRAARLSICSHCQRRRLAVSSAMARSSPAAGPRPSVATSSTALQAATSRIVDHLMHQYTLTYTLADGVKPNERISIATKRKGVTLLAPTRLAVKQ